MPRHRFKRNEKLYQYALRSDWTYSARLAIAGVVIGVLLVPFLLSGRPDMQPLATTIEFLGWVFAAGFAGIAIYRFNQQRQGTDAAEAEEEHAEPDEADGADDDDPGHDR